jgi:hypothetical protein
MRNKLLYDKLQARFGQVLTANEGAEGEEYRVCCPFCADKKNRLYINCKWGIYDPVSGSKNAHLVHCYNEDCVQPDADDAATYNKRCENRNELMETVYHGLNAVAELSPPSAAPAVTGALEWPGKVIRFDRLAAKKPDHYAVQYMKKRGFDPVQLGGEYGFVFCDKVTDNRYAMALGTILMPIYKDGELYSWISRFAGDEIDGVPLADTKIKKYYNCPGRPLSAVGYNLDRVMQYSTIVIAEGILDCIKTGPFATCLFTKSLPLSLKKMIVRGLMKYGGDATAVIMLDPEQDAKEKARGVPHHIERAAAAFEEYIPNVLRVYLPGGKDPGSMTHEAVMREIKKAAKEKGVKLNFNVRTEYQNGNADKLERTAAARSRLSANGKNRRGGRNRPADGVGQE